MNNCLRYARLLGLVLLLLVGVAPAQAARDEGQASVTPWSGPWWPHASGGLVRPLSKYDRVTGQQAASWERENHVETSPPPQDWFGHCHAWAAASVTEGEPGEGRRVQAVDFAVGDLKGLLTACHAQDVANSYGSRYDPGDGDAEHADLAPDELWRLLQVYVGQRKIPLILDLEAREQVFNYPVYQYRVEYEVGSDGWCDARLQLVVADNNVDLDHVGTRPALHEYTFQLQIQDGAIVMGSGEWTGDSVEDHPDFAWYPYVAVAENPHLEVEQVALILGTSILGGNAPDDADVPVDPTQPPSIEAVPASPPTAPPAVTPPTPPEPPEPPTPAPPTPAPPTPAPPTPTPTPPTPTPPTPPTPTPPTPTPPTPTPPTPTPPAPEPSPAAPSTPGPSTPPSPTPALPSPPTSPGPSIRVTPPPPPAAPEPPPPATTSPPREGADLPQPDARVEQLQDLLSPDELAGLVVDKTSHFFLDVQVDRGDGGSYSPGEPVYVSAVMRDLDQKGYTTGYLYLFDLGPENDLQLVYPQPGMPNRIQAGKVYRVPLAGGPSMFVPEGAGQHDLKGIVTLRPIRLTGFAAQTSPEQTVAGPPAGSTGRPPAVQPKPAARPPVGSAPVVRRVSQPLVVHPSCRVRLLRRFTSFRKGDPVNVAASHKIGPFAQDMCSYRVLQTPANP